MEECNDMKTLNAAAAKYNSISLIVRILCGLVIGVVQDSVETALNSAGDVEFAATAEYHQWRKEGKPLPAFLCK